MTNTNTSDSKSSHLNYANYPDLLPQLKTAEIQDEDDEETTDCRTELCDGDPECGDSWDGYCPDCADRIYAAEFEDDDDEIREPAQVSAAAMRRGDRLTFGNLNNVEIADVRVEKDQVLIWLLGDYSQTVTVFDATALVDNQSRAKRPRGTESVMSDTIRRHGRDILIPYKWLASRAGYTLPSEHIDRIIAAILGPYSTIPDAFDETITSLLTDTDLEQLSNDKDPYHGQAPPMSHCHAEASPRDPDQRYR